MSKTSRGANPPVEDRIYQQTNEQRQSQGLPKLARHRGLDRLARQHAEFLLHNRGKFSLEGRNVSHINFEKRALAAQRLYHIESLGENVIAGDRIDGDIGAKLVRGWLSAPGHRKNLLGK